MRQQFFNLEDLWSIGVIPDGQRIPVLTEETDSSIWISVNPMGAPRQTQRDKWAKRPVVQRYRMYKDIIKTADSRHGISNVIKDMGYVFAATFILSPPKSWSDKRKLLVDGMPHTGSVLPKKQQTKPDTDNLIKGVLDSLYGDDSHIWATPCIKIYGDTPGIKIYKDISIFFYDLNQALHQFQLQGW